MLYSLKSGGTKDHFKQVKVPGTPPLIHTAFRYIQGSVKTVFWVNMINWSSFIQIKFKKSR
jgi:hypothetical protein